MYHSKVSFLLFFSPLFFHLFFTLFLHFHLIHMRNPRGVMLECSCSCWRGTSRLSPLRCAKRLLMFTSQDKCRVFDVQQSGAPSFLWKGEREGIVCDKFLGHILDWKSCRDIFSNFIICVFEKSKIAMRTTRPLRRAWRYGIFSPFLFLCHLHATSYIFSNFFYHSSVLEIIS